MKIHFNGAARTVTGSQYLLEVNGKQLLLECGLYQGKRDEASLRNRNFRFDPASLDAVILSHAHIDHSGNLPNLVNRGYHRKIYCTPPTGRLADIMLRDSGHIQELDAEFVNKKRAKHGEPPVEPLYTQEDAAMVAQYLAPVEYGQVFYPVEGVTARLVDAGHILGSAAVVLDVLENGRRFRFWFSGDIGRLEMPLLRDPVLPEAVDYLMMESTYGDKPHADPREAYDEFHEVVERTVRRGGKVIIPAFAVGRTQELVYFLNEMISERQLPRIPVYVDSPLAVNASQIFQEFPQYFDSETMQFIRENRHPALAFDQLTYIRSVEESKALNGRKEPMVIISASGMAENGRILHHLANNIEDPKNTIAIVGWQAPDTLGRRLAERATQINIFGEKYIRRAEVVTIGGLSAHAGQNFLLKYALASKSQLRQVILVHGESKGSDPLRELLRERLSVPVDYPEMFETMEI
ncbi:MAG TPA: MBL fold metallo-hydrolase [Anaerolineaceae bacterium]|nr:MBL fold metallo-hydrolase [Anaerolineaceae bacterium]